MRILFCSFFFCSLLFNAAWAQEQIVKSLELKKYLYPEAMDSIPMEISNARFDQDERLMYKKTYLYNHHPAGTLKEERFSIFDSSKMTLEEEIIRYQRNKEPESERLKTKYWIYTGDEKSSKHISRSYIDESGEIVKEDTLTYDQDTNLIKQCIYSYTGNTSLYCENWKYNRKGRLCKNTLYSHWTTINFRSKVVKKKERKMIYCYRYKKGKLKKARGKRYSSKYYEDWKYDKEGRIAYYKKRKYRKAKNSTKRREQTGEKFSIFEEIWETKYENGLAVMQRHLSKGKEKEKKLITYREDGQKKSYEEYEMGRLKIKEDFTYNEAGDLSYKLTRHYNSKGELNYSLASTYNNRQQLIKEEQLVKNVVIRAREMTYNANGEKISDTLYDKNKQKIEKTMYFYEYH